MTSLCSA